MHNIVSIMGNLTRDPELRYSGDTAICKFGIALNEKWRQGGRDGELQERVHYIDCVAFGKTGETIEKYFEKGKQILVVGSLSYSSWEDRESGAKRSKLEVKVREFSFTGQRSDNDDQDGGRGRSNDRRGSRESSGDRGGGQRRDSDRKNERRDDTHQSRDDRNDGRDSGGGYDFDDIPF